MNEQGITVKKEDDMAEWYSQVVLKSQIADFAPVKGCMIIRPLGYAIWQKIMDTLNDSMHSKGVENAYFPTFIPESFFKKEAEHAEGFAPEVAWVENKDPDSERLALRPTSETIMYHSYARWIRSWRDLPLRINQWCNIVRWEVKDVKMFLRSREFLWQEGHCVYETAQERHKETMMYLEEYRKVLEDLLAIPVKAGKKSDRERFAGADATYTVEAFMPDGKALQCGTSHDLSQGFAKAFDIKFIGKDEKEHYPFQNSWGLSTRTIGAVIMQHSDNKGLVLPPRVAPIKAVVIPIIYKDKKDEVIEAARAISDKTGAKLDDREEYSSGWKFNNWEMRGVPVRIEIGPRDLENGCCVMVRRDNGEKSTVKLDEVEGKLDEMLEAIQQNLFDNAKKIWDDNTLEVDSWDEFIKAIEARKFVLAPHCGIDACEEIIKEDTTGATTRVIKEKHEGKCIKCGKKSAYKIYFAKNY